MFSVTTNMAGNCPEVCLKISSGVIAPVPVFGLSILGHCRDTATWKRTQKKRKKKKIILR